MDKARDACESWVNDASMIAGMGTLQETSADTIDDRTVIHGDVTVPNPGREPDPYPYEYVCAVDENGQIIDDGSSNILSGSG